MLLLSMAVLTSAFSKSVYRKSNSFIATRKETEHSRRLFELKQLESTTLSNTDVVAHSSKQKSSKSTLQSIISLLIPQVSKAERPKTVPPHRLSIHQLIYVILTSTFVTCLIIADVIGVKIFEFKLPFTILGHNSVEHTCGMITFPITFLLGDIINEYYGPKATRQTVYIGLVMSILVFFVMNIAQALPYLDKPFNVTPAAFDSIFGSAKLMYVASVSAYLIGQLSDIWLFGVLKRLTKGKLLWLRATGSTVVSQLLDSFVVSYIAFSFGKKFTGQVPATLKEVLNIAITGYSLKFVIAGFITPFIYIIRNFLHDKFGFEALPVDFDEE